MSKYVHDNIIEDADPHVPSDESVADDDVYVPEMIVDEEEDMDGYVTDYFESEDSQDQLVELSSRDNYTNWEVNEYLGNYFRFFGQKDMDIIYLYFLSGKKQEDIVKILGKTQPAISYDVTRIKEQMDFVIKFISSIDDFIVFITDDGNQLSTYDREMLTLFFYSTSIVKTARLMDIGNVTCRSHLMTLVNRMLSSNVDMYNLFKYILNNLNNIKKFVAKTDDE